MTVRRASSALHKWIGLSTDVKPGGALPVLSVFEEEDTEQVFVYLNGIWMNLSQHLFSFTVIPKIAINEVNIGDPRNVPELRAAIKLLEAKVNELINAN